MYTCQHNGEVLQITRSLMRVSFGTAGSFAGLFPLRVGVGYRCLSLAAATGLVRHFDEI